MRLTPRVASALTAVGLVGFSATVSLTSPRWARYFRRPAPAQEEEPRPAEGVASAAGHPHEPEPSAEAQRKISVKLFFEGPGQPGLVLEEREVPFSSDLSRQLRVLVEQLARGSQTGLLPTVSPDTKVLDVFVTARGVAYVDVSKEFSRVREGGSEAELLTVYSVVNSITTSFPAIRRVQLLIEDRPTLTLAGHVDLARPLPPDMTLLAAATLTPVESPAAPEGRP